jgi:hypothetical protein
MVLRRVAPPVPMPYSLSIDRDRQLVTTTVWGEFTVADVLEHQHALTHDPAFDPEFAQILDLTRVTKMSIDSEGIRTVAARRIFSPTARRAIVAGTPEAYGMARMFATYLEMNVGQTQLQVFMNKEEALRWLLGGSDPG